MTPDRFYVGPASRRLCGIVQLLLPRCYQLGPESGELERCSNLEIW